jgi:hypothetical protein
MSVLSDETNKHFSLMFLWDGIFAIRIQPLIHQPSTHEKKNILKFDAKGQGGGTT